MFCVKLLVYGWGVLVSSLDLREDVLETRQVIEEAGRKMKGGSREFSGTHIQRIICLRPSVYWSVRLRVHILMLLARVPRVQHQYALNSFENLALFSGTKLFWKSAPLWVAQHLTSPYLALRLCKNTSRTANKLGFIQVSSGIINISPGSWKFHLPGQLYCKRLIM